MAARRRAIRAVLVLTATPWALALSVGGLWLALSGWEVLPAARAACVVGGAFWIVSGQLLFMCLVADRLFPRASQRLVGPLEIGSSVAVILLFALAAAALVAFFASR